jgi:hypothetical protein
MCKVVCGAWGAESASRTRTLLNKLLDRGVRGPRLAIVYNLLLCSGRRSVLASSIEALFYNTVCTELSPDIVLYNTLLEAVSRSSSRDTVTRTDKIIGSMQVSPNDYTLMVMMHKVWSKLPPKETAERANVLFSRIENPSLASYCSLISCWCRVDVTRASRLVDSLISKSPLSGTLSESGIYASLIEAVAKSKQPQLADKLLRNLIDSCPYSKPDTRSVRAVLETWASSSASFRNCGEQAQSILDLALSRDVPLDGDMLQSTISAWFYQSENSIKLGAVDLLYKRARKENVPMSPQVYKQMLSIYGRLRHTADIAEEVLYRLMDEYPEQVDLICFNQVIEAWGRCSWQVGGTRAQQVFNSLKQMGIKPDVITYCSLISALTKSGGDTVLKAQELFDSMRTEGIRLDTRAYTLLITIWSKSKHPDAEEKVRELFDLMLLDKCPPNVVTYTALLNMYGSSKDPNASLYIVDIFDSIKREGLRLDAAGYSSLLSALGKSKDPNAPYKAENVFNEMLDAGVAADLTAWNILISICK